MIMQHSTGCCAGYGTMKYKSEQMRNYEMIKNVLREEEQYELAKAFRDIKDDGGGEIKNEKLNWKDERSTMKLLAKNCYFFLKILLRLVDYNSDIDNNELKYQIMEGEYLIEQAIEGNNVQDLVYVHNIVKRLVQSKIGLTKYGLPTYDKSNMKKTNTKIERARKYKWIYYLFLWLLFCFCVFVFVHQEFQCENSSSVCSNNRYILRNRCLGQVDFLCNACLNVQTFSKSALHFINYKLHQLTELLLNYSQKSSTLKITLVRI